MPGLDLGKVIPPLAVYQKCMKAKEYSEKSK